MVSASYENDLDECGRVVLKVEFVTDGPDVVDYSLVLVADDGNGFVTIRVYDGAHSVNEMHRYARTTGKQPAVRFHHGTLGEGMRAAMIEIADRYLQMIEGRDR